MTFVRLRSFHAALAAAAFVAAAVAVGAGRVRPGRDRQHPDRGRDSPPAGSSSSTARPSRSGAATTRRRSRPSWSIVDGAITATKGKGADLVSVDEYGDFELAVDFKVAKNGNSGIFYRGVESPTGADLPQRARVPGPRRRRPPRRQERAGSLLRRQLRHRPAAGRAPASRRGEWNSAKIVVKGAHVEHWLNGQKTADYELWSPEWKAKVAASKFKAWPTYGMAKSGRLSLQHHGDEVAFKNIKVRVLK